MTADRREVDLADALADLHGRRTRGEGTDVLAYRDRLGESHAEFLALADTDALLDDLLEPAPADVLPRDLGPYTLLRELGRGAVGVVYEAVHRTLRRRAAVKVLRHGFDADPQARERFRNEAASTARVRHDHVVEIYDASEVDGRPFYAMTLIEGRTLASLVKAREVPPPRELCRQAAAVADALEALHAAGVLHRDIKPSNLMVRPDGRMILADFGLARSADGLTLTRTGDALGTPLYMSPEQMLGRRGEDLDARADVYALGATLYEAIAGRPVFSAPDIAVLAQQVIAERPEPLRKVAPGCPAAIEKIVMKALEKERDDRYASAAAMRDDLLAIAEGRDGDVVGRPVGGTVRLLRTARARWVPLAAAFLVTFGAAWWWTHRAGSVELVTSPDGAEILLAGEVRGRTPVRLDLAPGSYDVTFRTDGFVDRARRVEVSAGGSAYVDVALQPRDEKDPVARMRLARSLELASLPYATERQRGTAVPVLLRPRGDMRLADLDGFAYDLADELPDGATLEFRRGDEVLASSPFAPSRIRDTLPLPAEVRGALRVGDVVTWGLRVAPSARRAGKKDLLAQFRVVADVDLAPVLAKIDRALPEGSEALRGEMRVRALAERGLWVAALRDADPLAEAYPDVLALQALARQLYVMLKLKDAPRALELIERISKFPADQTERLDAANPGGSK